MRGSNYYSINYYIYKTVNRRKPRSPESNPFALVLANLARYCTKTFGKLHFSLDTNTREVYIIIMLRRLNIWLDKKDLTRLATLAKKLTPGTKVAMLIRQAISEFLERHEKE